MHSYFSVAGRLGLAVLLVVGGLGLAGCATTVSVAVRPGQKILDRARLPVACLGIATPGAELPLERVVVENLATHEKVTLQLGDSLRPGRACYLQRRDPQNQVWNLIPAALAAGRYRLVSVEFNDPGWEVSGSFQFAVGEGNWVFEVRPGVVNYHGTFTIIVDWGAVSRSMEADIKDFSPLQGGHARVAMPARYRVVDTTSQDGAWAEKEIPALAGIPTAISVLFSSSQLFESNPALAPRLR